MREAKRCGCSFQQSGYAVAGERIRVNAASNCGRILIPARIVVSRSPVHRGHVKECVGLNRVHPTVPAAVMILNHLTAAP